MARRRGRIDTTQGPIRQALEDVGAFVFSTADTGDGFPDLIVGFRGRLFLLECKTGEGKLREKQKAFAAKLWALAGVCVTVARTPSEALYLIGATAQR